MTRSELPQAVRRWRDAADGWIRVDDPDSARNLAARTVPTERPRIVVVGETNRGKSSLVNALLGTPGLSPVDAGTSTCSYLVFGHAAEPYAIARFGGGMADISFPPARLRAWATLDGEPDADLPHPRWIEVGIPAELTSTMTVVDTPGVGGLVAAHADLAAEAAAAASAVVFVVDAAAPLTRGEVDFLRRVSERVEAVHFVITKTDAHRGWREIVASNQELLSRHAPRFAGAEFHPVSGRLADAAAATADEKIAGVLLQQSGIPRLRVVLQEAVAESAYLLADSNIVRTTATVLTGGVARLDLGRRTLSDGAAHGEVLRTRREQLAARRRAGTRGWQVMLRAEIQRARVDLVHDTAREVREASQLFRAAIDQADSADLKNMPFHIDACGQAMTARAHGRLIEAMGRICRSVLAELFQPQEMAVLVAQLATRPYSPLLTRAPEKTRNIDDTILTMSGAGMGFTLSRMVTMLPAAALPAAFGVVLAPVSIVVGGAAAYYLMRSRRRMADKAQLKQWLMEVLGEAKAQIDQNIAEQFIEAEEQLTLALDDVLTRQVAAVDEEIRQVDAALRLDATERAAQLRSIDERRAAGVALVTAGEALLQRLRPGGPLPRPDDGRPPAAALGTAGSGTAGPGTAGLGTAGPGTAGPGSAGPGSAARLPSRFAGLDLSALLAAGATARPNPREPPSPPPSRSTGATSGTGPRRHPDSS